MAPRTLAELRAFVQTDLDDAGAAVWTTGEIDRAVTRALRDYSLVCPHRTSGTHTVTVAGRSQTLAITGLAGVERIWYPYVSTDVDALPTWIKFDELPGGIVFCLGTAAPAVGEKLLVYYWAGHSLSGVDSATTTTVPAVDEHVLVLGAAGYAAVEKARTSIGTIQVSGYTPVHWREWGNARLVEFRNELQNCRRRLGALVNGPVAMG